MLVDRVDDPISNHWFHQTNPRAYVLDIAEAMRQISDKEITQSNRIVRALQLVRPDIAKESFRKKVQQAVFVDAIASDHPNPGYAERFIARAERRFGKLKARKLLFERSDILQTWQYRDAKFVPDAFLIDKERRTVVCYEVEDYRPLNPFSIGKYAAAWWTLEYIYWDLHLIAYDIFGNPRIIAFPHSEFVARDLRNARTRPIA
jgi:hypothetical protein